MPGHPFANLRAYYGWMFASPGEEGAVCGPWHPPVGGSGPRRQPRLASAVEGDDNWHHGCSVWCAISEPIPIVIIRRCTSWTLTPYGFDGWLVDDRTNGRCLSLSVAIKPGTIIVAASNFTPQPRHGYRLPDSAAGAEELNTDSMHHHG